MLPPATRKFNGGRRARLDLDAHEVGRQSQLRPHVDQIWILRPRGVVCRSFAAERLTLVSLSPGKSVCVRGDPDTESNIDDPL